MKHFRQTALACLIDCTSAYTGMRHAVGAALAIVLDGRRLVMTGHNNARSSKDRSRKKAVMAAI